MPAEPSFAYNSYIKGIYLEIPGGYTYRHHSFGIGDETDDQKDPFLGRQEILDSFVDILQSDRKNNSNRGSYLVTGYRGMGKTSFVNQAIKQYKARRIKKGFWDSFFYGIKNWFSNKEISSNRPVAEFRLSLAQSELKDIDILKHIVNQLIVKTEQQKDFRYIRWFSISNVFNWFWPLITSALVLLYFFLFTKGEKPDLKPVVENLLGIISFSALLTLFVFQVIDLFHRRMVRYKPWGRRLFFILFCVSLLFVIWWYDWIVSRIQSLIDRVWFDPLIITILLIGFGVFYIILKVITHSLGKKRSTIKEIHAKLELLQSRCNAQVSSEDQFRETFSSTVASLFRKNVLVYPIANPKEIEAELIIIIRELNAYFQCIFIFDELDKVDPSFDQNPFATVEKPAEKRTYLNDLRERRHLITHILGSLKYFINEAEAKFIFIAGREMFEAALADISDRQSSISSIFHRVVYVDSFLKDHSQPETIASSIGILVEQQLANVLLPKKYKPELDFFSRYYQYLTDHLKPITPDEIRNTEADVRKVEARKIIFVLQNFLGYLVYRSNGSPKKVVKLMEEYIIAPPLSDKKSKFNTDKDIIIAKQKMPAEVTHFLRFSYLDQYKLGFTAYLFQPFLTMYSSFMKRYSDSTLVSTPYLIDNLIKFHPFAFSAQNLELIPEILSTNKSPISRPFLEELITFLGQNHIRRTESGLFEYKFYDRTHNEITYLSKIFEDEAAAFNFTLDENYSVKAHLIYKIQQLRDTHRPMDDKESKAENPVSSIIFLNRLLGDVRFQDEEYEDAIVSYQDAIQMINFDRLQYANYFVTFVRLKLKLGLTYEKIKAYEFALGHYAGVVEEGGKMLADYGDKHAVIYRELLNLIMQAFSAALYLQEKLQEGITFQKMTRVVESFENLLSKASPNYENRDILRAAFYGSIGTALYYKNMVLPQKVNEKRVAIRDRWLFLAGLFDSLPRIGSRNDVLACFPSDLYELVINSRGEIPGTRDKNRIDGDGRISLTTYVYYKRTLQILLGGKDNGLPGILRTCARLIYAEEGQVSYRSLQHIRRLTGIGHALAKLGDFLLPAIIEPDKESGKKKIEVTEALGCFYNPNKKEWKESDAHKKVLSEYFPSEKAVGDDLKNKVHPRLVVHIYYLASLYFLQAGETANGAFQLRKILFALRALNLQAPKDNPKDMSITDVLAYLEHNLMKRILELSSWMSHSSDRPQLSKTKKYFGINTLRTPHQMSNELYGSLSNNPDTKETVLAYALLKTEWFDYKTKESLRASFKQIDEYKLLSPHGSISHQITRIMEFELHTSINYKLLKTYVEDEFKKVLSTVYANPVRGDIYLKTRFTIYEGEFRKYLNRLARKFTIYEGAHSWDRKFYHASKLYDIVKQEPLKKDGKKPDELVFETLLNQFDQVFKDKKQSKEEIQKQTENLARLEAWLRDYADLVINSVFNLCQIDRIINTYGINYILSYSYMAQTHEHLGMWLKHLHLCRILEQRYSTNKTYKPDTSIDQVLEDLIGPQLTTSLDALTSYQVALQYNYQAIQLHKEGNTYRHQINNLIYLEDDYNDNLYHFGAALERLKINSGSVRKKIDFLKKELDTANMYKYSTYIGHES